jgi:N-acetyl-anhydromuramyl-L-alanine amidase AmpD
MEGTIGGALSVLQNVNWQASWHFSIPKTGPPLQHYPLEAITWHAGLPGDRKTDTSLVGNLTLVGIEHEDYPDNMLNENQIHWTAEISKEIRRLCPHVGASPPTRRLNLWEHRELSATSCPSGLIPWANILEELTMGMTETEKTAFADLVDRVKELEENRTRVGNALGRFRTLFSSAGAGDKHGYSVTVKKS